jgi:hypothetical protein
MRFRLSLLSLSCFIVSRRITSLVYTLCLYLYISWHRGPSDQDRPNTTEGCRYLQYSPQVVFTDTTQMAKAGVSPVNLFYIVYLF